MGKVRDCFRKKNPFKDFHNDKSVLWSIYGGKKIGEISRKFHRIHYWLKYKFLVPFVWLIEILFGRLLTRDLKKDPWNKTLRVYQVAYENAQKDVWRLFDKNHERNVGNAAWSYKRCKNTDSDKLLTLLKKIQLTIAQNDTFYREFMNLLVFNIVKEFRDKYKDEDIYHFFYSSKNYNDITYFSVWNGKINEVIRDAKEKRRNQKI